MSGEREERIRARAYEIWQRAGCPEGREREHWDEAEREIDLEDRQRSANGPAAGAETAPESTRPSAQPAKGTRRKGAKGGASGEIEKEPEAPVKPQMRRGRI